MFSQHDNYASQDLSMQVSVGPGVLIGMGLTAVLVKYTFPYNWSWIQCLLFGGVLSATDPVAVAAILSEVALPLFLPLLRFSVATSVF